MYYLNSRYYDPEIGRFVNADDISFLDPETINGLNLYAYCGSNPVMFIDLLGLFAVTIGIVSIGLLALLGVATITYVEAEYHPIENATKDISDLLIETFKNIKNEVKFLFEKWIPGSWPGDDPTVAPGDDFIWRGPGEIGSERGEWYNPITGDQLHPDLNHKQPKGPHWGWKNKLKKILQDIFKIFPGGPPTLA